MMTLGLGAAVLFLAPLPGSGEAHARHRVVVPQYEVLDSYSDMEVRHYAGRVVAEVTVDGSARQASRRGFKLLAAYIYGSNHAAAAGDGTSGARRRHTRKVIARTASVDRRRDGDHWVVTFTMPPEYTLETLPRPNDSRIQLREIPPTTYAVANFRGRPAERTVTRRTDDLADRVQEIGREQQGEAVYARFDGPWKPRFLRRYELMVPVGG
jgi:hypothetical protein